MAVARFPEKQTQSPLLLASDELGVFSGRRKYKVRGWAIFRVTHTQLSTSPDLLRLHLGPASLLNTFNTAHMHKR